MLKIFLTYLIFAPLFFGLFFLLFDSFKIRRFLNFYKFYSLSNLIYIIFNSYKIISDDIVFKMTAGNWSRAFGVEFLISKGSVILLLFLALLFFLHSLNLKKRDLFKNFNCIQFLLILQSSLNGLILSNDLFNLYVFLELSCIACYGIYSFDKNPKFLKTLFNYLISNLNAGLFFLIGVFLIYNFTGNLNLDEIFIYLKNKKNLGLFSTIGGLFFMIAFVLKIGIIPFHKNVYNFYKESNINYTSLISNTVSKIYVFTLIKIISKTVSYDLFFNFYYTANIFLVFLALTVVIYAMVSLFENYIYNFFYMQIIYQSLQYFILIPFIGNEVFKFVIIYSIFFNGIAYFGILLIIKDIESKVNKINLNINELSFFLKRNRIYSSLVVFNLMSVSGFPLSYNFFQKIITYSEIIYSQKFIIFIILTISNLSILIANTRIMSSILKPEYYFLNHKNLENIDKKIEVKQTGGIIFSSILIVLIQILSLILIFFKI